MKPDPRVDYSRLNIEDQRPTLLDILFRKLRPLLEPNAPMDDDTFQALERNNTSYPGPDIYNGPKARDGSPVMRDWRGNTYNSLDEYIMKQQRNDPRGK